MRSCLLPILLFACVPSQSPLPAPPPPVQPVLTVSPLIPGTTATFRIEHAPARALVYVGGSPNGAGAGLCPNVLNGSCLGILPPLISLGSGRADAEGTVDIPVHVPASVPADYTIALQATALGRNGEAARMSNVVETHTLGATADCSDLQGTISADRTINAVDAPCQLTGDLIIAPGVTLTLDAGVDLLATGPYTIDVRGTLETRGSSVASVRMHAGPGASAGDWGGIDVADTGSVILAWTELSHATHGITTDDAAEVRIDHGDIHDCITGLAIDGGSNHHLRHSTLSNNTTGATVGWGTLHVERSTITDNTTGLRGTSASNLHVSNSLIANNTTGAYPESGTLRHNEFVDNDTAVNTGLAHVTIEHNRFAGNLTAGVILGGYPIRKRLNYNVFTHDSGHAVIYSGGYDDGTVDAEWNRWEGIDLITVEDGVLDVLDDMNLFRVDVWPFLRTESAGVGIIPEGIIDEDGDGFYSIATGGNDCDDTDPSAFPEGLDRSADGVDSDCDGRIDDDVSRDADADGHDHFVDCDDNDPARYPGAVEIRRNGIDEDCNGYDPADASSADLSGVLQGDLILTAAGSPYTLSADALVAPDRTLVLEPGATIVADAGTSLLVKGTLLGEGAPANPALLTAATSSPGDWDGVDILPGSAATLAHTRIELAARALDVENVPVSLDHVEIHDNLQGIWTDSASGSHLRASSVLRNGTGVYASWTNISIDRSTFMGNDTAIDSGSAATINLSNSTLTGNTLAMYAPAGTIAHNVISDNDIAISTALSHTQLRYNIIERNRVGVILGGYPVRKTLHYNSFTDNTEHAVVYSGGYDDGTIDATRNWWGSSDPAFIAAAIYDVFDDITTFKVDHAPALTAAHVGVGIIPLGTVDGDGDGFYSVASGGNDCDDGNANIRPEGLDTTADGVDDDCDGMPDDDVLADSDGDGVASDLDCDDADPLVLPGALEVPGNGIDEDCNGSDLAAPVGTSLSGVLSTDTWLRSGSYTIDADLALPPGVTLLVGAGADVTVTGGHELLIKGDLRIEGASDQPAVMSSTTGTPGDWMGIVLDDGASATVAHAKISHGAVCFDMSEASLQVSDSELSDCEIAVFADSPVALTIDGSDLLRNDTAVQIGWGQLTLTHSVVAHNDMGLRGTSASTMTVADSVFHDNLTGARVESGNVSHSEFYNNDTAIDTGFAHVQIVNNIIRDNIDGVFLGPYPVRKSLTGNSLLGNTGYAVIYGGGYDDGTIDAMANWWGTTDATQIASFVWDFDDDSALFDVDTSSPLAAPLVDVGPR